MYNTKAYIYDLLYSFKDYKKETSILLNILNKHQIVSDLSNILEAGCGTCSHMKYYAPNFKSVVGFDLNEEMIEIGKKKVNNCKLFKADMTNDNLLNTVQTNSFQVILCLFGSIGYIFPGEKLEKVFNIFYKLLSKNGVAIVEPFIDPSQFISNYSDITTYNGDDFKLARIGKSKRKYPNHKDEELVNRLIVNFHYMMTKHLQEGNVEYFEETHEMQMYTKEQFKKIGEKVGFKVEFDLLDKKVIVVLKK